jgi:hypothetical protein
VLPAGKIVHYTGYVLYNHLGVNGVIICAWGIALFFHGIVRWCVPSRIFHWPQFLSQYIQTVHALLDLRCMILSDVAAYDFFNGVGRCVLEFNPLSRALHCFTPIH